MRGRLSIIANIRVQLRFSVDVVVNVAKTKNTRYLLQRIRPIGIFLMVDLRHGRTKPLSGWVLLLVMLLWVVPRLTVIAYANRLGP